jgi:N-acetylglutamate synthase-like GNAT family acetyltransferase
MITIGLAGPADSNKILNLYNTCRYSGGILPTDAIVIAKEDRQVIGAVRLCVENDINMLRGMQILPAMQRQRIGSQMLYFCLPLMQRQTTYCLPYSHLTHFYSQIGFQLADETTLPAFIQTRLLNYRTDAIDMVPMVRVPKLRTLNTA